jgi:hypothetical protein
MKNFLAGLLGCLTIASAAHADVLTYEYTAKINQLSQYTWLEDRIPLTTTDRPGHIINLGDEVTGRFSIDTLTPRFANREDAGVVYSEYDGSTRNEISATIGHNDFNLESASSSGSYLSVQHGSTVNGGDNLTLRDFSEAPQGVHTFSISFSDSSGTTLGNSDLPTSLAGLNEAKFNYSFYINGTFTAIDMAADITALNLISVSAVPESNTYLMLLAGLPLLAWRRRAAC